MTGALLEACPKFAEGVRGATVAGASWETLAPPGRGEAHAEVWRRAVEDGYVGDVELRRPNGATLWLHGALQVERGFAGRARGLVFVGSEVTEAREAALEATRRVEALGRSLAVIEFTPDGQILTANGNFLSVVGWKLDEIVGRHHRMFVAPDYAASEEYAVFWARLSRGEFFSGQFPRRTKDGREIWIEATYNPIFGPDGRPYKVVKYASDVTALKKALGETRRVLQAVVDGDLSARMEGTYTGDLGALADAVGRSTDVLARMVRGIQRVATDMHDAITELEVGNVDVARRAGERAQGVAETSGEVAALLVSIRGNATTAREASTVAGETRGRAAQGGGVIEDLVGAMSAVESSSQRVVSIVRVIDEIAFQTNILSLNASVEAARAAEHGYGFAVVAGEVRALAQRAAVAATEIRGLIQDSAAKVHQGAELARASGRTFEAIADEVERVDSMIARIAEDSAQQVSRLDALASALSAIDRSTQADVTVTERTAATTARVAGDARTLSEQVAAFKTDDERSPARGGGAFDARRGGVEVGRAAAALR
jgi:methyl-accepting chemotaxis protein